MLQILDITITNMVEKFQAYMRPGIGEIKSNSIIYKEIWFYGHVFDSTVQFFSGSLFQFILRYCEYYNIVRPHKFY